MQPQPLASRGYRNQDFFCRKFHGSGRRRRGASSRLQAVRWQKAGGGCRQRQGPPASRQVGARAAGASCSCYNCLANNHYLQMSADEGLANGEAGGLC